MRAVAGIDDQIRESCLPLSLTLSSSQRNEKHWIVLWKFNGRRGWKRSLDEI